MKWTEPKHGSHFIRNTLSPHAGSVCSLAVPPLEQLCWRSWRKCPDLKPHPSIWQQVKEDPLSHSWICLDPHSFRQVTQLFVAGGWRITASDTFLSAVSHTSSSAAPGLVPDARPPPELWGQGERRRRVTGCLHRGCFRCMFQNRYASAGINYSCLHRQHNNSPSSSLCYTADFLYTTHGVRLKSSYKVLSRCLFWPFELVLSQSYSHPHTLASHAA